MAESEDDEKKPAPLPIGFRPDGTLPPFLGIHRHITSKSKGAPYIVSMERACQLLGFSEKRRELLRGLLRYRQALRRCGVRHGIQLIAGSFTEHGGAEPNDIDLTTVANVPEELLRDEDTEKRRRFLELADSRKTKVEFGVDAYLFPMLNILETLPQVLRMFNLYSHTKQRTWKGLIGVDMRSDDDPAHAALEGPLPPMPLADRDEDVTLAMTREAGAPRLTAHETVPSPPFAIRPARPLQDAPWAACIPMAIAESWGWDVTIHEAFEARWNGRPEPDGVTIEGNARVKRFLTAHFGHGIVTIRFPYVMRTPQGWNLHVRGPVNVGRADLIPLEGMVETDWAVAPFSMNWRFLTPNKTVRFEVGDVVGRLVPTRRGVLETFDPVVMSLQKDRSLERKVIAWNERRAEGAHRGTRSEYALGRFESGPTAVHHQVKLRLAPFRRTV